MAEGVLDFAADKGESKNDVGGNCYIIRPENSVDWMGILTDGSRNGHPFKKVVQLEGQHEDVDPGDLGDGDAVCGRKRSIQDAFGAGEDFVQGRQSGDYG